MRVKINSSNCKACLRCVAICHQGAIKVVAGFPEIDESRCVGCGVCVRSCPFGAIEFSFEGNKIEQIKRELNEISQKINFIQGRLNKF